MFQITIEKAMRLHDNLVTVMGGCQNKREFTNPLVDDSGNTYEARVPLGKALVFDDTRIILGLTGAYDAEALKGRTLVSA